MKKAKKYLSAAIVLSMAAALLAPIGTHKAKAAGFTAIAQYDFESGTGMQSSGIGTAPTVVNDAERGNVLQFANGETSKVINHDVDASIQERSWVIVEGSPSSLKFPNPFNNRSLTGATISFWVKLPNEQAGDVGADGDASDGPGASNGLVGFVDSEFRTMRHPDCVDGGHSDIVERGSRSFFGISAKPAAYFSQIHHNWIWAVDEEANLAYDIGTWKYCAVAITNETLRLYINGEEVKSTQILKGKRFYKSDEYNNPGNQGMPFLLDFLSNNMSYTFGGKAGTSVLVDKNSKQSITYGKVESNVECYVGFTGFSPTYAGTCIDDLSFFTKAFSGDEMKALYDAAKTPGGITVAAGGSTNTSSGSSGSNSGKGLSAEAAAAVAASTRLVSAPDGVTIGTPISILKNDPALSDTYNTLKTALDNTVPGLVAANPDWNGLKMSNNIFIMDIPLTGRELADGETATVEMNVPDGFDANMLWVLRINDDGTVTKCDITAVADGKLQFVTDKLCKFAVVQMTFGNGLPKTGVVGNVYFLIFGGALLTGGLILLKKKKTA